MFLKSYQLSYIHLIKLQKSYQLSYIHLIKLHCCLHVCVCEGIQLDQSPLSVTCKEIFNVSGGLYHLQTKQIEIRTLWDDVCQFWSRKCIHVFELHGQEVT